MRDELKLYILAKELHIDIDEVKSWSLEKQLKWLIVLRLINEGIEKKVRIDPPSFNKSMPVTFVFRRKKNHLFTFC